jgi:non-homologous end joining protein Ku
MIGKKVEGVAPAATAATVQPAGTVVDLMEVLKKSLKDSKARKKSPVAREKTVATGRGAKARKKSTSKVR